MAQALNSTIDNVRDLNELILKAKGCDIKLQFSDLDTFFLRVEVFTDGSFSKKKKRIYIHS